MSTEAYRIRCDGCGAIEEVPAASSGGPPEGWSVVSFEWRGEPFRSSHFTTGHLYGHLCAECTAVPVIQSLIRAVPGYPEAIASAERAATIAAEAADRAALLGPDNGAATAAAERLAP